MSPAEPKDVDSSNSLGEKRSSSSSSSDSDSESDKQEGKSSLPPNKRARSLPPTSYDPRVDTLIDQVSHLSNFIQMYFHQSMNNTPSFIPTVSPSASTDFLIKPHTDMVDLGEVKTVTDKSKLIKDASLSRVEVLNRLQHFETDAWKEVKYSRVLQNFLAKPGFIELKLNDELCHLNRGKDYLASTERSMAGLTNGLLEQKEIIRNNLQELVNWANSTPNELTPGNLYDKIVQLFGPSSQNYTVSEQLLQIVCGKRAECVEVRREKVISEVPNKNLQATLRRVPPSSEHLFAHNALMPVIQSLGGTNTWLNVPPYLRNVKKRNEPSPSTSAQSNRTNPPFRSGKNFTQKSHPKKFKKDSKTTNSNSSFRKDKK